MQEVLEKKPITSIDFNCDLAQAYGIYKNNAEYELLDYVSSVNISSGFHAGDPLTIREALLKAKQKNLVVGAHIGFSDIKGFGYTPMELTEDELESLILYQIGAITTFAKAYGLVIEHVRPHGAMYKMAGEDFNFACLLAKTVKKCSKWLVLYLPAGETAEKTADYTQTQIAREIMLEKTYNPDLTVDYSKQDNTDNGELIRRLQLLLHSSRIKNNLDGMSFAEVDTIHFANKYKNSLELAREACGLIKPTPVNYNNVKVSGWVD